MLKSHHTTVNGLRIYYRTIGNQNAPRVVFLHAWGVRLGKTRQLLGIGYDELLEELSKSYYVIAPEHPGLVRSDGPLSFWSYEDYAKSLNALLNRLNLNKFTLIGSSFGGGIGLTYALLYPKAVERLVLIHSVLPDRFQSKRSPFKLQLRLLRSPLPLFLKKWVVSAACGTPVRMVTRENFPGKVDFIARQQEASLQVNYSKLGVPCLLIWGSDDHQVHPIDQARMWQKELPNSRMKIVRGSVTFPYLQPAEAVGVLTSER